MEGLVTHRLAWVLAVAALAMAKEGGKRKLLHILTHSLVLVIMTMAALVKVSSMV